MAPLWCIAVLRCLCGECYKKHGDDVCLVRGMKIIVNVGMANGYVVTDFFKIFFMYGVEFRN